MASIVHLHLHSQYSLLDGANRLDDLLEAARAADMPAMALTDHGNMFGAIDFYNRANAAGIKPIIGMEAYVAQGSRTDRTPGRGSSNHLVLLARNETGYRNLIQLTSQSYLEGFYYKPRVDLELLRKYGEGLIALSACLKGKVNQLILGNQIDQATATAREFREIFDTATPGDQIKQIVVDLISGPTTEEATVDAGVERLHAPVHDLR